MVSLALALTLSVAGSSALPATLLPKGVVLEGTFAEGSQAYRWLAGAGGSLWLLDPLGQRVLRVEPAAEKTPPWHVTGTWPLPEKVPQTAYEQGFVGLAPWGRGGTWLVVAAEKRLWRLVEGRWEGPYALADDPADAVALSAQGLLLQTPRHPQGLVALVGEGGEVVRRFGRRILPPRAVLDVAENTFRLAVSPDGTSLVAAQLWGPSAKRWNLATFAEEDFRLACPVAKQLEHVREHLLHELVRQLDRQCVACELVHFATGLQLLDDGRLLVQVGVQPYFERFGPRVSWEGSVALAMGTEELTGLSWVAVEGGALVLGPGGLVWFEWAESSAMARVAVVREGGKAVPGAHVLLSAHGAPVAERETDAAGYVWLPLPPPGVWLQLEVRAPGYRLWDKAGPSPTILQEPVVLVPRDQLCVQAREKASRAPVRRFRLTTLGLGRGGVQLGEDGAEVEVDDPEGVGCAESPWEYPVALRVRSEGFALWEARLEEKPAAPLLAELEPGAAVEVTVESRGGRPVAGARVAFWPREEVASPTRVVAGEEFILTTNSMGKAEFPFLPVAAYRVVVEHEAYVPFVQVWELEPAWQSKQVTLSQGKEVDVTVVTARARTPVVGAQVEVRGQDNELLQRPLRCVTEAGGSCTVAHVPPGSWRLHVQAPGYGGRHRVLSVEEGEGRLPVVVELSKGARIRGVVRGTEQYPKGSLSVRVSAPGVGPVEVEVEPGGQFRVEEGPTGLVLFVVKDEQRATLWWTHKELSPEEDEHWVVLELPKPIEVRGQVEEAGSPCSRCLLRWELVSADLLSPRHALEADDAGRFQVSLSRPGLWRVRVHLPSGEVVGEETLQVLEDRELVISLAKARLEGVVVDEAGQGVANCEVLVVSAEGRLLAKAESNAQGRFVVAPVPRRALRVKAVGESGVAETEVHAGEGREVQLVLRGRARWQLQVVEEETQVPLSRVRVGLLGRSGSWSVFDVTADGNGVFRIPAAPAEVRALVLSAPASAVTTLWTNGARVERAALPRRHWSLTVEVKPEAGEPCTVQLVGAAGVPVALHSDLPPGPLPMAGSPRAFLNFLPQGSYTVVVRTCQGREYQVPVLLAPGQRAHVVVP